MENENVPKIYLDIVQLSRIKCPKFSPVSSLLWRENNNSTLEILKWYNVSAIWIMRTKESMVECQVIDTRSILNWHLMDIYGQTLEWHLINTLVNIQLGVDYIICRHTMECWLKHE